MENIGRRHLLQRFFAAGSAAAVGAIATQAEAAAGAAATADAAAPEAAPEAAAQATEAFEASMEPTQAIVIRPGRRRGRRIIVRPRRRVCWRRRNRLICTWRG